MSSTSQLCRRIKLRDIHVLMAVVEVGSMAKAATVLKVSQPVISKVIADLEYFLGARLLDRSSHGVEPTIYGRALLESSFAIFDELRQGVNEIEHLADQEAGELTIGCSEAAALSIVPAAISSLRKANSRALVHATLVNSLQEQKNALRTRVIELSIGRVRPSVQDPEFTTEVLLDEKFSVVTGPNGDFHHRSLIELHELIDCKWILPPAENLSGHIVSDIFRKKGLKLPRACVQTSSFRLIQKLIESGPYFALLPNALLPSMRQNSELVTLPITLPNLVSPVGVTRLRHRNPGPLANKFIEFVRKAAHSIYFTEVDASSYSPLPSEEFRKY